MLKLGGRFLSKEKDYFASGFIVTPLRENKLDVITERKILEPYEGYVKC